MTRALTSVWHLKLRELFAVAMLVFCFEGLDLTEKLNDQLINRCVCFESQYYSWLNILIGYSSAFSHTSWQWEKYLFAVRTPLFPEVKCISCMCVHGAVVLCEKVQGQPHPDLSLSSRLCLFLIWASDLWRSLGCVYLLTSFHFSNGLCTAGW